MTGLRSRPWSEEEDQILISEKQRNSTYKSIGNILGRSGKSVRSRWRRVKNNIDQNNPSYIEGDINHQTISFPPGRVVSLEQLLETFKVDLDIWEVERYVINKWEVGRKDIEKDIEWIGGAADGYVKDSGKIFVEPLFQVKAWLIRKEPIHLEPIIHPVSFKFKKYLPETQKLDKNIYLSLIIPDLHMGFLRDLQTGNLDSFHDRDYLSVVLSVARDLQPDTLVFLGDNLDLSDWSDKFIRSPEFYFTTQPAINELAWWLSQFRSSCPQTRMYYIEGNHENRMEKSIITHMASAYRLKPANEKTELPSMSIPRLLNLEDLKVEWVGNYPDGIVWLNDGLKCIHGDKSSSTPGKSAINILNSSDVSVIFGHIHRSESAIKSKHTRNGFNILKALSPGCGCRLDGIIPGHSISHNWSQGFALAYYDNNNYHSIESIDVQDGTAIHSNKIYKSDFNNEELLEMLSK